MGAFLLFVALFIAFVLLTGIFCLSLSMKAYQFWLDQFSAPFRAVNWVIQVCSKELVYAFGSVILVSIFVLLSRSIHHP